MSAALSSDGCQSVQPCSRRRRRKAALDEEECYHEHAQRSAPQCVDASSGDDDDKCVRHSTSTYFYSTCDAELMRYVGPRRLNCRTVVLLYSRSVTLPIVFEDSDIKRN